MIAYDCIWLRYWKCESDLLLFWSFILSNTGDECFLVCCIILDAASQLLSQYCSAAYTQFASNWRTVGMLHNLFNSYYPWSMGPRKCVISSVIKKSLPHWAGISFTSVESQLQEGVTELHMNANAFAAVKHDGSILTWGSQKHLGTQKVGCLQEKLPQNLETSQNIIDILYIYIYIHIIHGICTWCL